MRRVGLLLAAIIGAGAAQAAPLVGPWPVADPTHVLVLGTPHLSGIEQLRPEWLEPVLSRLAAWKPEVITIEALSGPECDLLRRYERSWPDTANDYCKRVETVAALAQATLGLDAPEAEAEAEKAVAALGPAPSPSARRRAASLFAAAGNLTSAVVQWLRLVPAERRAGDGVSEALATALNAQSERRNENVLIAATLAARLGLDRVYPTDDHLSDRLQAEAPPGLGEALQAIWSGPVPPLVERARSGPSQLKDGASVLTFYRYLNRADVGEASVRADMGKAYSAPSPGKHGRRYVAWWEARNLRMVANIRQAIGYHAGKRALVIVGATHKPYFDAYLSMMHEVRLVPAAEVLGK